MPKQSPVAIPPVFDGDKFTPQAELSAQTAQMMQMASEIHALIPDGTTPGMQRAIGQQKDYVRLEMARHAAFIEGYATALTQAGLIPPKEWEDIGRFVIAVMHNPQGLAQKEAEAEPPPEDAHDPLATQSVPIDSPSADSVG